MAAYLWDIIFLLIGYKLQLGPISSFSIFALVSMGQNFWHLDKGTDVHVNMGQQFQQLILTPGGKKVDSGLDISS